MTRLTETTRHRTALPTLAAIVALGACSPASDGGAGDDRRILRVAYTREIDVLNAFTSQNLVDITFSMVEGLITTDENNEYVPVLAREIPTIENGLVVEGDDGSVVITWPLQEGVRWHDGEPFTSEDVCFTWRFVASEGSQTYNRDHYLGITECATPDPHTVVFTWDGTYAYYAGMFESILPEHILGGMTTEEIVNYEPYNRGSRTIGTGPFKFAEWKAGEYIRVVRNEDYWRGAEYPAIDEIVWAFIPDNNTRLNALRAGAYHYGQIEPTQVEQVSGMPEYDVHLISSNSVMHFDVNAGTDRGRVLFADRAVRQALFHAIDRPAISDQLMQGTVTVADGPINTTSPFYNPDVTTYDFEPDRSRRMLDAAGWVPGDDGIRAKGGERFSFTIMNRGGSNDRIAIAQVIQAQLKDVGVEVRFETLESAAWTQRWRRGEWEAIVSAWFLPADPSFTRLYQCDGPNNMTGLCDPALDEVMIASDRALSLADRKPLLDQAQARLADAALSLPIYYNVIPEVVSTEIGNYRGSGTNFGSFWNLYEWTLAP
jgi:peptide/nickel transport system substrate-binding protein